MQAGLLWFDNDPKRALTDKALDAAARFEEKLGVLATEVQINVKTLAAEQEITSRSGHALKLVPVHNILVDHFWVGFATSEA
jgi:hypothetical protein